MRKFIVVLSLTALLLTACTNNRLQTTSIPGAAGYAPTEAMRTVPAGTLEAALTAESAGGGLPTQSVTRTPLTFTSGAMMPGCTVMSVEATDAPEGDSLFGPITEDDWVIGPATATVTLLEYSDFQCPGCAAVAPELAKIAKDFPQDVRFVYRHFPLMSIHDKAGLGVQAAEAAGRQGKFWEMHELLFAKQSEWSLMTPEDFTTWLSSQAETLKLDVAQFEKDLVDPALAQIATAAWEKGQELQLPSTPFLVLNDQMWPSDLPKSYDVISTIINLELLEAKQYDRCPAMIINPAKQYFANIETSKGDLVLELFADKSPLAVNNFVFLAREGWYDGVPFHRVIADFMAQTGDPTGTGYGGPGYAFQNETSPDLLFDEAGVVAMANSGPDANGSQFFITYGPAHNLDGNYTIFGRLLEGMDILKTITLRNPATDNPLPEPDIIIQVTIVEK